MHEAATHYAVCITCSALVKLGTSRRHRSRRCPCGHLLPLIIAVALASHHVPSTLVLLSSAAYCAANVLAVALNSFLVVGLTHGQFGLPELGFVGGPLFLRLVGCVVYMNLYRHHRCAWYCDDSYFDVNILHNILAVELPLAAGTLFENMQLITMTLFAATMGKVQFGIFFFATSSLYTAINASVTRMGIAWSLVCLWRVHQSHPNLLGLSYGMICGYARRGVRAAQLAPRG
ncbi:unnamed protein product [Peronospora destructor]|uniref:Uncharacterized protein n=1 Tax=Peronospora destructor TaxID=86335 RepID=A0AAV0TH29_9STRA|nr:unnamed protein product [Peronospora destructor]